MPVLTAQHIETAISEAFTDLRDAYIQGNKQAVQPEPMRLYLRGLLTFITEGIEKQLSGSTHQGFLKALARSNFLRRAALDAFGPCMVLEMKLAREEFDAAPEEDASESTLDWLLSSISSLIKKPAPKPVRRAPAAPPACTEETLNYYFKLLVDAYVAFAVDMARRLRDDTSVLSRAFGAKGGVMGMYFTGSDPHQCAHRVVILDFGDKKVVYKPTDLTFQLLLMGDEKSYAFAQFNHRAFSAHKHSLFRILDLPVVRILPGPQRPSEYGYMEFKHRITDLPESKLPSFFYSFGRLAGAASIFGLTDLHGENCMATAEGPCLIDAEMGFSLSPGDDWLAPTGIKSALRPPRGDLDPTIIGGTFVPDDGAIFKVLGDHPLSDFNAYVRRVEDKKWVSGKEYLGPLLEGMVNAFDTTRERIEPVRRWLSLVRTVGPFTRVPLDTSLMGIFYIDGVTQRLAGELDPSDPPEDDFTQWLSWYGGVSNSTPAALFRPDDPQTLYSPDRKTTVPRACAGNEIVVSGLMELQARLNKLVEQPPRNLQEKLDGWLKAAFS